MTILCSRIVEYESDDDLADGKFDLQYEMLASADEFGNLGSRNFEIEGTDVDIRSLLSTGSSIKLAF